MTLSLPALLLMLLAAAVAGGIVVGLTVQLHYSRRLADAVRWNMRLQSRPGWERHTL